MSERIEELRAEYEAARDAYDVAYAATIDDAFTETAAAACDAAYVASYYAAFVTAKAALEAAEKKNNQ